MPSPELAVGIANLPNQRYVFLSTSFRDASLSQDKFAYSDIQAQDCSKTWRCVYDYACWYAQFLISVNWHGRVGESGLGILTMNTKDVDNPRKNDVLQYAIFNDNKELSRP